MNIIGGDVAQHMLLYGRNVGIVHTRYVCSMYSMLKDTGIVGEAVEDKPRVNIIGGDVAQHVAVWTE